MSTTDALNRKFSFGWDAAGRLTSQRVLPWKLVATVDADPYGGLLEMARAIQSVEAVMQHGDDFLGSIKGLPFLGAENLIAFRHLREGLLAGPRAAGRQKAVIRAR